MININEPAASDNHILKSSLKSKEKLLNVGHFNSQSMRPSSLGSKLDEIKCILKNNYLDIVGISETWLKPYVSNTTVAIPGYKLYRNDRRGNRGGGVSLYISEKLKAKVVARSIESSIEYLFAEVMLNQSRVLVGVLYRPSGDLDSIDEVLSELMSRYENAIIMGDFNLNLLDTGVKNSCDSFFQRFDSKIIHNDKPTHFDVHHNSRSLIDFFVVDNASPLVSSHQFWIPGISKHALVYHSFDLFKVNLPESFFYRDYKNVNYDSLLSEANLLNLTDFYGTSNVNVQLCIMENALTELFNNHIPVKQWIPSPIANQNPWYSPAIVDSKSLRDLAFRAYTEQPSTANWKIFCKHRNKTTQLIKDAKKDFGKVYFRTDQPMKKLWNKIGGTGLLGDKCADFSNLSPDQFNSHFTEQQTGCLSSRSDELLPEDESSFSFRNVDQDEVWKAVFSLKSNATGVDDMPIKFIKMVMPSFSRHILHLFNTIITTSTVPLGWKMAKVLPVPKSSSPTGVSDYRPVSLLPALSKVWESLVKDQMIKHLNNRKCLYKNQSGFRRFHNTTTTVMDITEFARINMDKKLVTILLLLDFSKAFDSIEHSILCRKLKLQFFFSSSACNLLFSYLTDRRQCVAIGKDTSGYKDLKRGVPQGSVLGPLLFSLYINDLPSCIKHCLVHIFADDVQVASFAKLDNLQSCIREMNSDIRAISSWAAENCLSLNPLKSQAIVIYRSTITNMDPLVVGGIDIPYVSKVNSLGMIINETLTWDEHVANICGKVCFTLRRLYSVNQYLPRHLKAQLIRSLILPFFLYGCEIYSGCSAGCLYKLNLCLNTAVRFIHSLRKYDRISHQVLSFLGCDLKSFFELRTLIFLFKIIKNEAPTYLFERLEFARSVRTRQLLIPIHSTLVMDRSFVVRASNLWNDTSIEMKNSVSISVFKRKCQESYFGSSGGGS